MWHRQRIFHLHEIHYPIFVANYDANGVVVSFAARITLKMWFGTRSGWTSSVFFTRRFAVMTVRALFVVAAPGKEETVSFRRIADVLRRSFRARRAKVFGCSVETRFRYVRKMFCLHGWATEWGYYIVCVWRRRQFVKLALTCEGNNICWSLMCSKNRYDEAFCTLSLCLLSSKVECREGLNERNCAYFLETSIGQWRMSTLLSWWRYTPLWASVVLCAGDIFVREFAVTGLTGIEDFFVFLPSRDVWG